MIRSRATRRARLAALPLVAAVLVAGCSDDPDDRAGAAAAADAAPAPGRAAAAVALAEQRTVIDVRTPEEFAEGHVEGADRIGLADPDFAARIADLDRDGAYVVYCRTGNRSAQAATQMRAAGLDVYDGGGLTDMLDGGWPAA